MAAAAVAGAWPCRPGRRRIRRRARMHGGRPAPTTHTSRGCAHHRAPLGCRHDRLCRPVANVEGILDVEQRAANEAQVVAAAGAGQGPAACRAGATGSGGFERHRRRRRGPARPASGRAAHPNRKPASEAKIATSTSAMLQRLKPQSSATLRLTSCGALYHRSSCTRSGAIGLKAKRAPPRCLPPPRGAAAPAAHAPAARVRFEVRGV